MHVKMGGCVFWLLGGQIRIIRGADAGTVLSKPRNSNLKYAFLRNMASRGYRLAIVSEKINRQTESEQPNPGCPNPARRKRKHRPSRRSPDWS